ncbi:MAG: hypothetical protein ACR2M1_16330 [Gemmatimonadaceae bacterium]
MAQPSDRPRASPRWRHDPRLVSYAAIALGAFVRAAHIFSAGFPLSDGGLFLRMTQDLQAAHYHLPVFTTYNNASIPFAYSPLGFYVAGAVNSVTGISLLQLFRFIPLVATVLTVIAFYYLARTMLRDERTVAAAVLAFALLPRSYVWMLMGGGLTRAAGLLFAIIALQQVYKLYTRREWRYAATAALACALTVLSHLSTANFLAFSIVLFFLFYGRHRFGFLSSVAVAAGAVLLTAPWWGTVVAQHGLAPFHAARASSGSFFGNVIDRYVVVMRLAHFNTGIGGEALFPLISVLAVMGALASLRPGRFILPVWWVLIVVLDARGGMNYAVIPVAMLAGIAVVHVLIPGLRSLYSGAVSPGQQPRLDAHLDPTMDSAVEQRHSGMARLTRFVPALVLGLLLLYGLGTSLTRNPDFKGEASFLTALTPSDRTAMQWVAHNTPPTSRFLVVSGRVWQLDKISEWFPALANRTSVSTVQGSEWLPGFNEGAEAADAFQARCHAADGRCLAQWADATGQSFNHVYVPKMPIDPCCTPLIAALRRDPRYIPVYDGPGAFIAALR